MEFVLDLKADVPTNNGTLYPRTVLNEAFKRAITKQGGLPLVKYTRDDDVIRGCSGIPKRECGWTGIKTQHCRRWNYHD